MSSKQGSAGSGVTDDRVSTLEEPLIREEEEDERLNEGEPRVMEESGLGSLHHGHPVASFVRGSTLEEEALEQKARSDPNLQEPKEHSFAFKSVGPYSSRPSLSRRAFNRTRDFFGRVQHSFSFVQPRETPPTTDVHYRHTFNGSTAVNPEGRSNASSKESDAMRGESLLSAQNLSEVPLTEMTSEGYVDIREFERSRSRLSAAAGENSFVGSIVDLQQCTFQTTQVVNALNTCQKFVVKPNGFLLKLIGWRRFRKETSDLTQPCYVRTANFLYPLFIFLLLTIALVVQSLLCFTRSSLFVETINGTAFLFCGPQLVTTVLVPDVLLLLSYLYGLYLFRFRLPEHFYALMESVFLSFTWVPSHSTNKKTKRVVAVLVGFLIAALCLVVFTILLNVLRMVYFSPVSTEIRVTLGPNPAVLVTPEAGKLPLSNLSAPSPTERAFENGDIFRDSPEGLIIFLAVVLFIGVIMFDIFYVVVITNFASQCQLLIYLIHNISDRMKNTTTSVDVAIKEVHNLREYLRLLNDRYSHIVSMLIFIFVMIAVLLIRELIDLEALPPSNNFYTISPFVISLLGVVNWVAYTAVPVIQAVRVTYAGRLIRRLGMELRARPYLYAETAMLDLDSFENYCVNAKVQVKLALIPMYPSVVVGVLFLGAIAFISFNVSSGGFQWAPWL